MTTTLKLEETAKQTSATKNETVHMGLYDAFASPDSERGYRSNFLSFDARPDLEVLAREQGVSAVENPEDLYGDFWPDDESVDDFLAARKRWREQGRSPDS
jgi:hypothetical protein